MSSQETQASTAVAVKSTARAAPLVLDPVPVLDTARFEHMQRIAKVMCASSLIPESLRTRGKGNDIEPLEPEEIFANCFLIVNQAVRWGMDPFAVISCCSVVYGRLMYEGKLVAAVLEAKLGIRLNYRWNEANGDALAIIVNATGPDGRLVKDENGQVKEVSGTVGEWKTSGNGSPWKGAQSRKMLAYRGAREWARLYEPGTMLGVYSDDEMTDLAENARFARATNVNRIGAAVGNPLDDEAPAPSRVRGNTAAISDADHVVDKDGVIVKDKNGELAARDKKLVEDTDARMAEIAKRRAVEDAAAEAARKADEDAIAAKAKHDADAGAAAAKAAAEAKAYRTAEEKRIADEARASVAGRRAAAAEDRETAERAHDDQMGRQQESANADKGGGAEAPQVSREHDAAPPDKPTEAQLSKAAEDGARAYAKGLPKRAAPMAYREPGAEDLMAAWTGAYDKAKQADMGG